ncbi:MAG TPA: hypothetical protein VFS63_14120 [Pseudolabrys sp.]|jgi:hypothetical protein|nr:hypothetical protein [Pseudolabrys sp.]
MRTFAIVPLALVVVVASAAAARDKPTRFWNLTLYTVTSLRLSPAGEEKWGPDQCKNDEDGTVDHDERLRVTGVKTGRYDVKIADKIGRVCTVRNIDVKEGKVFTIEEKQLTDCKK